MTTRVGETSLNQQKRSKASQTTVVGPATGQAIVPQMESRVSLLLLPHNATDYTLSLSQGAADFQGIFVKAGGAPVLLSLASHAAAVKGPYFVVTAAPPTFITFIEALNQEL